MYRWSSPSFLLLLMMMSLLMVEGDQQQQHYVLVHGAGHGAWCWYKVQTLLKKAGHNVTSLDLAGAGIDFTDPSTILTFEDYNKPLTNFLLSLPQDHKVVLVGHSAGGLSLTHAIHMFGTSKIGAAVFVGAVMLRSGFMTQEDIDIVFPNASKGVKSVLGQEGHESLAMTSGLPFEPEFLQRTLYNESPEEDVTLSFALLKHPPYPAISAACFNNTSEDVDRVPRVYVKTEKDRVFKQEQQDAMIRRWPPNKVLSLCSDHSVFFSAPKQFVAEVLLKVGTQAFLFNSI